MVMIMNHHNVHFSDDDLYYDGCVLMTITMMAMIITIAMKRMRMMEMSNGNWRFRVNHAETG